MAAVSRRVLLGLLAGLPLALGGVPESDQRRYARIHREKWAAFWEAQAASVQQRLDLALGLHAMEAAP